jgi:peptide/nickel transport system substrate-binding protein
VRAEIQNYWAQPLCSLRLRRRRLLGAAAAGGGLAALVLAGCGGKQAASPSQPSTTSAQGTPKPGGTLKSPLSGTGSANPPTLNPYSSTGGNIVQMVSDFHYSRLLMFPTGQGIDPIDYTKVSGDVAEKWEQVDPQTVVFHLRNNVKFHNVPPVNGRPLDKDDIQFSNDRESQDALNKLSWTNVVDKLETPDDYTARFTLKHVYAPFINLCAEPQHLRFVPKEFISANLQERPIGTGPWVFQKFEKDVAITWSKHQAYHIAGRPYADGWQAGLVGDASTIIANLKAGTYQFSLGLNSANYEELKSEVPGLMFDVWPNSVLQGIYFNYDIKPWNDVRVRQALSMAIDRDGIIKAMDPTGKAVWPTSLGVFGYWWLDPKSQAFGPNAKYFKRDLKTAKQLLSAAGYPNGIDAPLHYTPFYGKVSEQNFQLVAATVKDAGFRFTLSGQDYPAYLSSTFLGKFSDGLAIGPLYKTTDPDDMYYSVYHPDSVRKNWSGSGPDTPGADTQMLNAFAQQQKELDQAKRLAEIQDLQRYMAEKMYIIPFPGGSSLAVHRPEAQSFYLKDSNASGTEVGMNIWLANA